MSDSSYDADAVPEQPPSTSNESNVCGQCSSRCPFSRLSPENIEGTLQHYSQNIEELQGALFFRRPIAFAALFVSVNAFFFLYRKLALPFYAELCLIGIIYFTWKLVPGQIKSTIKALLFPGQLNKGGNDEPNRVRDTNELIAPLNKVLAPFHAFGKIMRKLGQDETIIGMAIYASVFFCLFIITAAVDFFWPVVIITNLLLILPGVSTLPQVYPFTLKAVDSLKTLGKDVEKQAQPVESAE